MTEREDLLKQIEFLNWRKAILNFKASQIEDTDPELADHYDAEWNADNNEIGRLLARLAARSGANQP